MTHIETLTPAQVQSAQRVLSAGTWGITAGAVLFSVFTVTPLIERVTPDGWGWTAPILPLVVDAAVVIVVRLDATVDRLRTSAGRWPALLRWLTGLMTLLLNVGDSALKGDATGVAVHSVAPLLLIVTAEAARSYRAAIGRALEGIERSRREEAEREAAEQAAREQRARVDREHETARREHAEQAAREHAERLERERLDREDRQRREDREHAVLLEQQRADREATERREQREAQQARERRELEQRARAEREQREREAAEQAARDRAAAERRAAREQREQRPMNTVNDTVNKAPATPAMNTEKLSEQAAREHIAAAVNANSTVTVRTLADETGWSIGWVSARRQELQLTGTGE
ncbi:DUF2637 domain-containing protein (plasmid) [Streptomyces sp. NBC_01220]|uniref:DUF2637 domain-containing protein n=1 Tax=Streptomyces sp. NBC_01220 TaxID=2903781 RepID=UPI002F91369C|nr:DUF2637 domain-containing protein [Streptomyces sp. NBC_01220]WSQ49668.1 DUF2637 domain-containing protein [Streptomyces sp. NBC_01220]